jgi:hypothetical protein
MIIVFKINDKINPVGKCAKIYIENMDYYIDFFNRNQNKWFKSNRLVEIWDVNSSSTVRTIINYLRLNYNLTIISSNNGYKLSNNKKEIKEYIKRLNYRALTQLSASKGIEKKLNKI